MENEPDKPASSTPPPPDFPPPPSPSAVPPPPDLSAPPSGPRMPDIPPPPPPIAPPPQATRVEPKSEPAKFDSDEDEDVDAPPPGSEAAFETRVIAGILDCFIAGGISWVIGILSSKLGMLGACGYLLVRDALPFLEGHSVGKRIMKIKAVTLDGKSLAGDWQSSVVRNLLIAIPPFGLLEAYILYSRKDKGGSLRRLGDEWAKTKVVVAKEPSAL